MKDIHIVTVFLVSMIILVGCNAFAECPKGQYLVTHVEDGDTITVKGYDKPIRILGIDAPENKYNYKVKKQAKRYGVSEKQVLIMGSNAYRFARNKLLDKCVELKLDYRNKGKYGRPLRYVFIDGEDYQEYMLINDLVFSYCHDKKITEYKFYNSLSKYKCE